MSKTFDEQKCRVCGCTWNRPCEPACAWFDASLCTSCALVAEALAAWQEGAYRANKAALWREVEAVARAEFAHPKHDPMDGRARSLLTQALGRKPRTKR
jgi:hypothetical protein